MLDLRGGDDLTAKEPSLLWAYEHGHGDTNFIQPQEMILTVSQSPSSPQPILSRRVLPQLDRPIFTSCRIQPSIRAIRHTPHRPMMSLPDLQLLPLLKIIHMHPRIAASASDKLAFSHIDRNTIDLLRQGVAFKQRPGESGTVEEVDRLACCDTQDAVAGGGGRGRGTRS